MITYILFTRILGLWLAVSMALAMIALSDLLFAHGHSLRSFGKRLVMSLTWPLALFSDSGRRQLLKGFRYSQVKGKDDEENSDTSVDHRKP